MGGRIRKNFAVGLLAFATLAAAGLLFRLQQPAAASVRFGKTVRVDDLYQAGL
jgi:hypothetical protein